MVSNLPSISVNEKICKNIQENHVKIVDLMVKFCQKNKFLIFCKVRIQLSSTKRSMVKQ